MLAPRRIRKGLPAALALALASLPGAAPGAEPPAQPVNFSLFHPLSIGSDPDVRTRFRLNVIWGQVGEVRGVDLGGLVARTRGDSRGLRLTLLTSAVLGESRGLSAAGLVDLVHGEARGLQLAGLAAYDRAGFAGIQLAGLLGFAGGTATGVQLSGVFTLADRAQTLFQLSGVGTAVGGDLRGAQLSGGLNFVEGGLVGGQGGVLNFAGTFRGIQLGGVNVALEANGPQIGLVNWSESHSSVPIGLASFSSDSNTDWFVEGSSLVGISTGIRTSVHGWRASAAVGGTDLANEEPRVVAFGWWWGFEAPVGRSWRLVPDVGFVHLTTDEPEEGQDENRPAGQLRVLAEYRFGPRFAVYGGGGLSVELTRYGSDAESDVEGLAVLGVSLF